MTQRLVQSTVAGPVAVFADPLVWDVVCTNLPILLRRGGVTVEDGRAVTFADIHSPTVHSLIFSCGYVPY